MSYLPIDVSLTKQPSTQALTIVEVLKVNVSKEYRCPRYWFFKQPELWSDLWTGAMLNARGHFLAGA